MDDVQESVLASCPPRWEVPTDTLGSQESGRGHHPPTPRKLHLCAWLSATKSKPKFLGLSPISPHRSGMRLCSERLGAEEMPATTTRGSAGPRTWFLQEPWSGVALWLGSVSPKLGRVPAASSAPPGQTGFSGTNPPTRPSLNMQPACGRIQLQDMAPQPWVHGCWGSHAPLCPNTPFSQIFAFFLCPPLPLPSPLGAQ